MERQNSEQAPSQEPSTSPTPQSHLLPTLNNTPQHTHPPAMTGTCPYLAKESFQKEPVRFSS